MLTTAVSHIYGLYVCTLLGPWLGYYVCLLSAFDLETFCRVCQVYSVWLLQHLKILTSNSFYKRNVLHWLDWCLLWPWHLRSLP